MDHVFISYVRENKEVVDRLYQELKSRGIQVWLDRDKIDPGVRWQWAIRQAIRSGVFFIACFSKEFHERNKTYMNEELTLAIEELRQLPIDKVWFVPIKLNECEIPNWDIGRGETLQDFQYISLYEDWEVSIQNILNVIQYESKSAEAYFMSGYEKEKMSDVRGAIADYDKALRLKPDYAEVYYNRAKVKSRLGYVEAAIVDYDEALRLKPDFVEAYNNRGAAKGLMGESTSAIVDYDEAIRLKPDYAGAYYNRGNAKKELGQIQEAILDLKTALELAEQIGNTNLKAHIKRALKYLY